MLGEQLVEEVGRITGTRVLTPGPHGPKIESSFEAAGTILGTGARDMGTFKSVTRPDGTLFAEGQGVVMTEDGEAASWVGQGVGRFTGDGGAVWRGAVYFQTASEKLARLNSVAAIYEFDIDAEGQTQAKIWEWT